MVDFPINSLVISMFSVAVTLIGVKVSVLKYADNIILMVTSPEGLHTGLNILKNYW